MKNLSLTLPGLFLLLLLANSCNKEKTDAEAEQTFTFSMSDTMMARCPLYEAKNEQLVTELRLFGKITADNNKVAQVYPIVGGNVIRINVELGDYVQRGELLAVVRSGEVAGFQKEKLDAMNDLATAEKNLQVARDMFAGKLLPEKEVSAAEREVEKARAELDRVNELYQIYSLKQGSIYNITAPMSGFIVAKDINQNEQLRSDRTEPIFTIAEINEVWVLANVNESDIPSIKLDCPAEVRTLSFPDHVYQGKVDKVFNAIDPDTKAMKARVRIPNPDFKLKPEMNATINLRYPENRQLVAIPSSALIFDKGKNWVMVFRNRNDIETRQVKTWSQLGDKTFLESGLQPGEKIIAKNGLLIYDALND